MWKVSEGPFGNVTTHTAFGNLGICLDVPKTGDNYASVASPLPILTLSKNTVYKIRLRMNSSQTSPGHTPFWDFIIENNFNAATGKGLNLYAMDAFFLDNVGGANAVLNPDSFTEVDLYWTPAAVRTPQWEQVFSNSTYAVNKNARLRFRVMDVDSNAALLNDQKYGSVCLISYLIEAIPIDRVKEVATLVDITAPVSNTNKPPGSGNMEVQSYLGASVVFSGGTLTLRPSGEGVRNELVTVTPASDADGGANPAWPFTNMADAWPIPWLSGRLYELTAELSAPTLADAAHPFDVIWMGMDTPTNEVNCESYVTAVKGIASPKYTAPQPYTFFYYTQHETASTHSQLHFLRWRLMFGNSTVVNFPNASDTTNTGGVRVHRVRVRQMEAP